MRLNLGCGGNDVKSGYVNLDIRGLPGVVQCDVSDPVAMSEYYGATEILAYDVLEHFDRQTARECLKLWVDLLAPGGTLKIRCPELNHAVKVARSDEWLEQLLYGGQDYPENQHLCGFTLPMLAAILIDAGLEIVDVDLTPAGNMEVEARKCT